MLAARLTSTESLRFPVGVTPKIDGIRCIITPDGPRTRKLLPIPNEHIAELLMSLPVGYDGELTSGPNIHTTSSAVMTHFGEPKFTYHVFDDFSRPHDDYMTRLELMQNKFRYDTFPPNIVQFLFPVIARDLNNLAEITQDYIAAGYEGSCFRLLDSPYKYGRSTLSEQYLVKWKQYEDTEATIIGVEELHHNDNEATTDNLGHTKRSKHQDNLIPGGMLGSLVVVSPKWSVPFRIGSGFTDLERRFLWADRDTLIGRVITFRYHTHAIKDAPREPRFLRFRRD